MLFLVVMLPVCFADSLSYDANGNLVTGDGKYREYNSLNQLISVYNGSDSSGLLLEEFTYHPTEERVLVKKDYVNNETTYYFSKSFVRVVNSSGSYNQTFVYHNGQLVAQDVDGVVDYVHTDHLGSSTVVTDENGMVIENTTYSPYGEILTGGSSKLDYEGKEFDSVLGSYDFHFRQYNPELAIFTQPDTLIPNIFDPQSLNRYMFERGNPYGRIDPDGHIAPLLVVAAVLIGAIMAVSYAMFLIDSYEYAKKVWNGERTAADAWNYYTSAALNMVGMKFSVVVGVYLSVVDYAKLKIANILSEDDEIDEKGVCEKEECINDYSENDIQAPSNLVGNNDFIIKPYNEKSLIDYVDEGKVCVPGPIYQQQCTIDENGNRDCYTVLVESKC